MTCSGRRATRQRRSLGPSYRSVREPVPAREPGGSLSGTSKTPPRGHEGGHEEEREEEHEHEHKLEHEREHEQEHADDSDDDDHQEREEEDPVSRPMLAN